MFAFVRIEHVNPAGFGFIGPAGVAMNEPFQKQQFGIIRIVLAPFATHFEGFR